MEGASALVQFYLTTVTQDLILSIYNDEWLMIKRDDIAGRVGFLSNAMVVIDIAAVRVS